MADTDSDSNQGGFTTDGSKVTGFSSMHDSGTGGSPSLGNFPLFPYVSCVGDDVNGCAYPKKSRKINFSNDSVKATPGYFGLTLASDIAVDMTTSQHTSLFRFKFPTASSTGNETRPLILIDLTDLSDSRQDNGSVSVDASSGRITGNARFLPSFGSGNYVAYFCADFSGPLRDNGIFANSRASTDVKDLKISRSINGYPLPGGAFVRFNNPGDSYILARVGVSFISSEQACSSAETEIPSFDFDATHSKAESLWRDKISPIVVSRNGITDSSILTNLYSGIYRTMVNPQDNTGENPLWRSDEPYFDSFYW